MELEYWGIKEIKELTGVGSTKASQILQAAKRLYTNRFVSSKARKCDVLKVLNLQEEENEIQKAKS